MQPITATIHVDDAMLATKGQRFANYFIDSIVYFIIILMVGVIAGLLSNFGLDGMIIWISNMDSFTEITLNWFIMILYYIFMESLTQRSVGKYITGTMVVCYDGSKPDAGAIGVRSLCRLIPFEQFSFLGSLGRGWHDTLSKTYVVDKWKYESALQLKNSFDEIGRGETI